MATSKRSSTHVKNGKPDREKGLAYYRSMLTIAKENKDHPSIIKFKAIIACLEKKVEDEKKK